MNFKGIIKSINTTEIGSEKPYCLVIETDSKQFLPYYATATEMKHLRVGDMVEVVEVPSIKRLTENTGDKVDAVAKNGKVLAYKIGKTGRINREIARKLLEEAETNGGFLEDGVARRVRWSAE